MDLRVWLEQVEEMGELERIRGVNPDHELGALTEIVRRTTPTRPALLFEEIVGYEGGGRVLTGLHNTLRRLALTTSMRHADADDREFLQAWRRRLNELEPIPPRYVESGPVLENVQEGAAIDVTRFPAPLWHEEDGGRYLGTADVVITRDPETGAINLGTYRVMVQGPDRVTVYISPGKHGRIHRDKYQAARRPCPVVVSFGHHPLLFLGATSHLPVGFQELEFIGGIAGEPVPVIEGKYTGLPIPAYSEIAIEGEILFNEELLPEGPFGEFTGYYASGSRREFPLRIQRLMFRDDPIVTGSPPGVPPGEATFAMTRNRSALVWNRLEAVGVPGIAAVSCHEVGAGMLFTVVAVKQMYPGHARQAGLVANNVAGGAYMNRFVVVVDDDVDPFDLQQVIWAVATRCDPAEDIQILHRGWSGPLDPIIPPERKGFHSRALIDATRPWEWRDRFPRVADVSPALWKATQERWRGLLRRLGAAQ